MVPLEKLQGGEDGMNNPGENTPGEVTFRARDAPDDLGTDMTEAGMAVE